MIYDQTCASEKRRRRKRGTFPDPDVRILINERVCEGCGDCGVQSNCVAVQPVETAFGRKRQIDQSVCNKDFSCLKGFCPSFVTVHGAKLKKAEAPDVPDDLPDPVRAPLEGTMGILVTGVGGTGVVTVGAVIGMAAHLEGLGAGVIDMAGLAQKGGAVLSHIKLSKNREDVTTIRVGPGGASAVLACDIVVAGGAKVLAAIGPNATVIANTHEQLPGEFTRDVDFSLPTRRIVQALAERATLHAFDATAAARALFGDTIAANSIVLGAAYQSGALPLSAESLEEAIHLNGAAVAMNIGAFRLGRLSVADPARFAATLDAARVAPLPHRTLPETLDERIARNVASLTAYQNAAWATRYADRIAALRKAAGDKVAEVAAKELYRLMAVKDEYEVARLYTDGGFEAQLRDAFAGYDGLTFHLAPPAISRTDPKTGRPAKMAFGGWLRRAFPLLAAHEAPARHAARRLRAQPRAPGGPQGPRRIRGDARPHRRHRHVSADGRRRRAGGMAVPHQGLRAGAHRQYRRGAHRAGPPPRRLRRRDEGADRRRVVRRGAEPRLPRSRPSPRARPARPRAPAPSTGSAGPSPRDRPGLGHAGWRGRRPCR